MPVLFIFAFSLIASLLLHFFGLKTLKHFQFKQSVRECGPQTHKAKSGTPVMGGLMIIAALNILALVFLPWLAPASGGLFPPFTNEVIILLTLFTLTGVIGFIDDFLIVKYGKNNGLKARYKLLGQLIIAGFFCTYLLKNDFHLMVSPFLHLLGMDNPILYVLFSSFIVIGVSNAVNLSDGLDGLASGISIIVLLVFAFIAWHLNATAVQFNSPQLFYLALLAAIVVLSFLVFNYNPAKMFMGDVGSLALGTLLAGFALLLRAELYLAFVGVVFVWDTLSVILQVGHFRLTKGKRLFKMSPFHHHLELCNWSEKKIVHCAWAVTAVMGVLAVLFRIR